MTAAEVTELGIVVRTEHVLIHFSLASFQPSLLFSHGESPFLSMKHQPA
jgi:hypothetical protein